MLFLASFTKVHMDGNIAFWIRNESAALLQHLNETFQEYLHSPDAKGKIFDFIGKS